MTDSDKKSPPKLQLTRTVEAGKIQQTFSRGRSKTVQVEVKKTRTFSREGGKLIEQRDASGRVASPGAEGMPSSPVDHEMEARLQALRKSGADSRTELPPPPKQELKPRRQEPEPAPAPMPDVTEAAKPAPKVKTDAERDPRARFAEEEGDARKSAHGKDAKAPKVKAKATVDRREKVKLTLTNAMEQEERMRSLASLKRQRQKVRRQSEDFEEDAGDRQSREVIIPEVITVQELANRMAVRQQEVIKALMKLGVMAAGSQSIDADTAELIASEFGFKFKRVAESDVEDILKDGSPEALELISRAPVVTIMGHVDHGKTSLLDAIRSTNVTAGEAGGITQHIGAYQVTTESGDKVTFLDTPGHAAFTAMRARGAKVTDIVVLVVAADDGIMPQTVEAINHAKAANVPIIVAINKMDKPDANPRKVKEALLSHELVAEDMGGDIQCIEVSATQKMNLDGLLEAILLQAEVLNLQASSNTRASGAVIESRIDKGRGVVATLLVQSGTLRVGDIIVAGQGFGKVKALLNDQGKAITQAEPALPVEVLGLSEVPDAGDEFHMVPSEKQAREIEEYREKKERDLRAAAHATASGSGNIEQLFKTAASGGKELNIIVKGDVQGSVEAIIGSADKLSNDEVKVKVVHAAAGGVTESDVTLAHATGALIVGFNVRSEAKARDQAEREGVDIRYYSIIYDLLDDMKGLVEGLVAPKMREQFLGTAEIMQVFKITKVGKVAGCLVREGIVKRGAGVRLIRDNVVIHEGKLKTLKRLKDEQSEVKQGMECGMAFENYEDIREHDMIEAFEVVSDKK